MVYMITVLGGVEHTPTVKLRAALRRHRTTLDLDHYDRFGTTLLIAPRQTDKPWAGEPWWYSVHWAIPALCIHPGRELGTCTESPSMVTPDEDEDHWTHVGYSIISDISHLSMPPKLTTPEVTETEIDAAEGRQPGTTQLLGGRDGVRKWLQGHINQAWTGTPASHQIDWDTFILETIRPLYQSLKPPTLTTAQRVTAAGARYFRAQQEEFNARASIAGLIKNDHDANVAAGTENGEKTRWHQVTGLSRATLNKMSKCGPNDYVPDEPD